MCLRYRMLVVVMKVRCNRGLLLLIRMRMMIRGVISLLRVVMIMIIRLMMRSSSVMDWNWYWRIPVEHDLLHLNEMARGTDVTKCFG